MKIVNLSKSKLEFTINQMIDAFEKCSELEVEGLAFSTSYKTPYIVGGMRYEVVFTNFDGGNTKKIGSISVKSSGGTIDYKITGNEDKKLMTNFTTRLLKKVCDIENEQFKKVFTSYDSTEERDDRLKELLGEEIKEEIKTKKTEPQKKKWFYLF